MGPETMSETTDNTAPGRSGDVPGVRLTVEVAGLVETWEGPLIGSALGSALAVAQRVAAELGGRYELAQRLERELGDGDTDPEYRGPGEDDQP